MGGRIKKVCMFVLNPCTNDARVLKEAATLGEAGYDVKIIAIISEDAPQFEEKKESFTIYRVQPRALLFYVKKILIRGNRNNGSVLKGTATTSQSQVRISNGKENRVADSDQISLQPFYNFRKIVKEKIKEFLRKFHQSSTYISYWLKAKKLAVSFNADIYHAHDLNTLLPAYLAARKTGAKVIYDSHELFTEILTWKKSQKFFFTTLEKSLIKRVDKIITINHSIADELVKRYNISYPYLILNCPQPSNDKFIHASENLLKKAANIPNDKKLILYQGGFSANRGLEELIEAFKYLDEDYYLVFMGYGKLKSDLEALVRKNKLKDRICFLPAVPQDVLLEYSSSADLGIIPYKPVSLNNYYTLPNKLFEYINSNIPIAASDLPELRRVINGYNIGYLFDPHKPENIAAAIDYIMCDGERYLVMKDNTKKAAKDFNWGHESKKLLECYSSL